MAHPFIACPLSWTNYTKTQTSVKHSFSKLRVAFNNVYRHIKLCNLSNIKCMVQVRHAVTAFVTIEAMLRKSIYTTELCNDCKAVIMY